MSKPTDVRPGDRFGRWTVLYEGERHLTPKGQSLRACVCRCDCGEVKPVKLQNLTRGTSQSCGCLTLEANTTHGLHAHPLYLLWFGMLERCRNERNASFRHYGGRGIQVCPDWHGIPEGLLRYIAWIEANLGPRPEGNYPSGLPLYSIDRINNDGNYEPGNLRWATVSQQQRNKRPFSRPGQRKMRRVADLQLCESRITFPQVRRLAKSRSRRASKDGARFESSRRRAPSHLTPARGTGYLQVP